MAPPIRRAQPTMPPVGMGKPQPKPEASKPEQPAEQPKPEQPKPEQPAEQSAEQPAEQTTYDGSPFAVIGREIAVQSVRYHAHGLGQILSLDSETIRGVLEQVLSEYGE